MTFEELNAAMKVLLETEDIAQAIELYRQEENNISTFNDSQKYIINEKIMILEYKSAHYDSSMRINEYLESIAHNLDKQYVLNASLWRINICAAQKEYNKALYNANQMKLDLSENSSYKDILEADINNTLLRIFIDTKKYKRMRKLAKKMISNNIDGHSKVKMLMNVGVAYYSLGKYSIASSIFNYILTITNEIFFLGCANLYLARMTVYEEKKDIYIKAINCFRQLENLHLANITQREYSSLFDEDE